MYALSWACEDSGGSRSIVFQVPTMWGHLALPLLGLFCSQKSLCSIVREILVPPPPKKKKRMKGEVKEKLGLAGGWSEEALNMNWVLSKSEEPGGLRSLGLQSRTEQLTLALSQHLEPLYSHLLGVVVYNWASLVAQTMKNLPVMQETWVWSLGQADPLKKEMATHSNVLAWRIPWTEEPGRLQSMVLQRVRHDWVTNSCT